MIASILYINFAAFRNDVEHENPNYEDDLEMTITRAQANLFWNLEITFETIFLFNMILQFFVAYKKNDSIYPVRNLMKIALNQTKSEF